MYTKKQDCKQIVPVLQLQISFNDQMQMRMAQTTFTFQDSQKGQTRGKFSSM